MSDHSDNYLNSIKTYIEKLEDENTKLKEFAELLGQIVITPFGVADVPAKTFGVVVGIDPYHHRFYELEDKRAIGVRFDSSPQGTHWFTWGILDIPIVSSKGAIPKIMRIEDWQKNLDKIDRIRRKLGAASKKLRQGTEATDTPDSSGFEVTGNGREAR
jgi:hypothetical protein